jgi:hypothetical protein
MARLPVVGGDLDEWGTILNDYLLVEHMPDGRHNDGVFNVRTFGAKADGQSNDAPAIQAALDAAEASGGVVWLPPADNAYRCDDPLLVPGHVSMNGGYGGMRRGLRLWQESPRGSVLHVHTQADFITLSHNAVLDGLEIYYPEQKTSGEPDAYGWTVRIPAHQHGATIRNLCSPNPYNFIYASADGFLIDGVQGYPLAVGIELDRVADVPRINNIHFNGNCWSDAQQSLRDWVQNSGVCLRAYGVEELMGHNLFAFGYLRGMWFSPYAGDVFFPGNYGSVNNFGFDSVQEGILVDDRGISNRQGLSLSNGRIIPFAGQVGARAGLKLADTVPDQGPAISMSNISFFGPHERSIWIEPTSGARIAVFGGQATEYTHEMFLCQSAAAAVRLVGVRSFNGSGPRVNNPGGGDVVDLAPMSG